MILVSVIPISLAQDLLHSGGMHWILFHGETFVPEEFTYWYGEAPSQGDIDAIERILAAVGPDHAVEVLAE